MAAVSDATAQLTAGQQRQIASHEDKLAEAIEAAVAGLAAKSERPLTVLKVDRPVEVNKGPVWA